jgi:integrase
LATTQEIEILTGLDRTIELNIRGEIAQFPMYCNIEGMRKSTVKTFSNVIIRLARLANLHDDVNVKKVIASLKKKNGEEIDENTKVAYCIAYTAFLKSIGKTWVVPKYTYTKKLPEFLPTAEELDCLIAGSGWKLRPLLQLIVETGMRINEALSLNWTCVNFDKRIITLTKAEKRSNPRVFKASEKLIGMLGDLHRENDKLFGKTTGQSAQSSLNNSRRNLAKKLSNPRIGKIYFHLIRHYYGTVQYHKTHDIFHVAKMLGHKSVLNTQIYVNLELMMFNDTADEYIGKVATTQAEKLKLIEQGFEFVSADPDGTQYYRKRK